MLHDRIGLEYLSQLMLRRGIRHLVISPGSRNAPIVEAFCRKPGIRCIPIIDERCAGFFALGMAQQLRLPVAIACTSGTAALNLAPAIAEAYYQQLPLLVLTADRPAELIDQGDGQTIRQSGIFANFIRKSLQLPQSLKTANDLWYTNRLISEALNACLYPVAGPVHLNMPFAEPLYGNLPPEVDTAADFRVQPLMAAPEDESRLLLVEEWNLAKKKMILVGQHIPDKGLEEVLARLSQDPSLIVLTETTSNISDPNFVSCIDRCLAAMSGDKQIFSPDLLITLGGAVVSKRIKTFLREAPVKGHWHVEPGQHCMDTYQHLTRAIPMQAGDLLLQLMPHLKHADSSFSHLWKELAQNASRAHKDFLDSCPWSDLKIFQAIMENLPPEYDIQLGNSTPVRYSQLFEIRHNYRFDSNRGTSGIDGSLSTASGACFASGKPTVIITGDIGFFYDSNALWNKYLPPGLRIIMINNQGGGIFRFIDGPDKSVFLEEYYETRHQTSARHLAKAFNLDYQLAGEQDDLPAIMAGFFEPASRAGILEISSPPEISADTLKAYFRALAKPGQQTY